MEITRDSVEHYAKLANLSFSEEEIAKMTLEFGTILDYVAKIGELDLGDVEATTHVFANQPMMRSDEAGESLGAELALANAPDKESGHFLIPKVIKVK